MASAATVGLRVPMCEMEIVRPSSQGGWKAPPQDVSYCRGSRGVVPSRAQSTSSSREPSPFLQVQKPCLALPPLAQMES